MPEWDPEWTQKAEIDLWFDQQHIDYKGPAGSNIVTFMEAVTGFAISSQGARM